jgi:hypothetical protein
MPSRKQKPYSAYLSPFDVIASRCGKEFGRVRVAALDSLDAMTDGALMIPGVELFDFSVDFRVEAIRA